MHSPIKMCRVRLQLGSTALIDNFSTVIEFGSRIGLIGRNGAGKSTLIQVFLGLRESTCGVIERPEDLRMGYVAQINARSGLSGGQAFHAALSRALENDPNCLILDEPTNHLDFANRASLGRFLASWPGTLVIASHDTQLLSVQVDILWNIREGAVQIFYGNYGDWRAQRAAERLALQKKREALKEEAADLKADLQAELHRQAQSRKAHRKENDKNLLRLYQETASATAGKNTRKLQQKRAQVDQALKEVPYVNEELPHFNLSAAKMCIGAVVQITAGVASYGEKAVLNNLSFTALSGERIEIAGPNGIGKSTLVKALLGEPSILRAGTWSAPKLAYVGYLEQNYGGLPKEGSVLEVYQRVRPGIGENELRRELSRYLFKTNEAVNKPVSALSGGERARLSLALCACRPLELLILDEPTNNLDLEMCNYLLGALKTFPGTLLVVSHDADFVKELKVTMQWKLG